MRPLMKTLSCLALLACHLGPGSAGTLSTSLSRVPVASPSASVAASAASVPVALSSDTASAQAALPSPSAKRSADARPGDGQASRAWLAAQASGTQASTTRPTLSGPVLQQVHERYVKSFSDPIPAQFSTTAH